MEMWEKGTKKELGERVIAKTSKHWGSLKVISKSITYLAIFFLF